MKVNVVKMKVRSRARDRRSASHKSRAMIRPLILGLFFAAIIISLMMKGEA